MPALDHIALWTDRRDELASGLVALGLHVIEQTERFTLVGGDALRGKLTLFDADGPRVPGRLAAVALTVPDLDAAAQALARHQPRRVDEGLAVELAGLPLQLVADGGEPFDLATVSLRVPDPEAAIQGFSALGLALGRGGGRLELSSDAHSSEEGGLPLLNHLAVKVDDADQCGEQASAHGFSIVDTVDAANTYAVFVEGPAGIKLEYVEHKPEFALV